MTDQITRALAREAGILVQTCVTRDVVAEGARRHDSSPLATIVLGRALTAATLIGGLLKVGQRVALKFESNGPISKLLVESNSSSAVRGYITPATIDLASDGPAPGSLGLFGNVGLLSVNKDLGTRELAQSAVTLQESDLDANLVHYFAQSEQLLTALQTGVALNADGSVATAGGVLLQAMPSVDEVALRQVTERLMRLPAPERWANAGLDMTGVLAVLFGDVQYATLETRPVHFHCSCSRDRTRRALELLGADDLLSLAAEGEAVVDCHFCHERYVFDRAELETLAAHVMGDAP